MDVGDGILGDGYLKMADVGVERGVQDALLGDLASRRLVEPLAAAPTR